MEDFMRIYFIMFWLVCFFGPILCCFVVRFVWRFIKEQRELRRIKRELEEWGKTKSISDQGFTIQSWNRYQDMLKKRRSKN